MTDPEPVESPNEVAPGTGDAARPRPADGPPHPPLP